MHAAVLTYNGEVYSFGMSDRGCLGSIVDDTDPRAASRGEKVTGFISVDGDVDDGSE